MPEIFADVVANIRSDSSGLRAELLASEQATVKSANAIQATLDRVKTQTRNPFTGQFSRQADLPNMGRLMAADAEFAAKANANLGGSFKAVGAHSLSARHSVQALQGSLFLVTGQTGFFAVEALRAASHLGKLASSAGSLSGVMRGAASSVKEFVIAMGPVGIALVAAGVAYKLISDAIDEDLARAEARMDRLMGQLPALDAFAKAQKELGLLTGKITPFEARKAELASQGIEGESAKRIIEKEEEVEAVKYRKQVMKEINEEEKEAAAVQKGNMERRAQFETDLISKRLAAEKELAKESLNRIKTQQDAVKSALVEAGIKPSTFINDPVMKQLALIKEKNAPVDVREGATFGIRAQTFRGNAPSGVFGEQKEQEKTTKAVKDGNKILAEIAKLLHPNVPILGFTIGQ